jgi:hypothetical protein
MVAAVGFGLLVFLALTGEIIFTSVNTNYTVPAALTELAATVPTGITLVPAELVNWLKNIY